MNARAQAFLLEADEITRRLFIPESSDEEFREGLYVEDVREQVRQFNHDADFLRHAGLSFPCIRMDENADVPVALSDCFEGPSPFQTVEHFKQLFDRWSHRDARRNVLNDVDKTVAAVRRGVADFLSSRIASVVDFLQSSGAGPCPVARLSLSRFGGSRLKTVGFVVTVDSSTPGLRIHVSPSFRLEWRYFGGPSPATFSLTGGIYSFAADGGPSTAITMDLAKFDIPYGTVSPTLNL
jgi:hypothetical protein